MHTVTQAIAVKLFKETARSKESFSLHPKRLACTVSALRTSSTQRCPIQANLLPNCHYSRSGLRTRAQRCRRPAGDRRSAHTRPLSGHHDQDRHATAHQGDVRKRATLRSRLGRGGAAGGEGGPEDALRFFPTPQPSVLPRSPAAPERSQDGSLPAAPPPQNAPEPCSGGKALVHQIGRAHV